MLEIKNLSISFPGENGPIQAVKNLTLSLEKGKCLGIVGESGSGKSVSSLALMQLLDDRAIIQGEAWLKTESGSKNLLLSSEKEMQKIRGRKIAMIFQEPMTSLNPVYTVGHQVAEALKIHKICPAKQIKSRVIELFNQVKLPNPEEIYQRYPHEISGGQKQRVMIAMALSCKPDLLIADEPTTALDVTVQKEIIQLLKDLQQEVDMGMIFISHDLNLVGEIADDLAVMYRGDLVEYGSSTEIFTKASHPYTKGLLACRPDLDTPKGPLLTIDYFLEGKEVSSQAFTPQNTLEEDILRVENLSSWYPLKRNFFGKPIAWLKAVDQVSFSVRKGETLGLVGESGCGKSSLGRTIIRLQEAHGGKVLFQGKDLLELSAREMRKVRKDIQLIFQDPYASLNPRMTIGKAIQEPMEVHKIHPAKERKAKTEELLKKVGLDESYFNRYPHELSGGQRQRVGIARALAVEPKCIICDESVSALDVSVQAQVLNLLNQLKEEFQLTYIFISHDLSVVKYMSDRLMVMNKGKIEEFGLAEDIYKNPQSAYTKKLIEAVPKSGSL